MKENNEIRSSAHSKYRCQYHIVFAPKFRRKEIYGKLKKRYRANTAKIMRAKRCANNRSRSMPRPYTYSLIFAYEISDHNNIYTLLLYVI